MQRRDFLTLLGGAVRWPFTAWAQGLPTIGALSINSSETDRHRMDAFRQGLKETGFVDGQNVAVDYRGVDGRRERLAQLAADFVHRRVAVLFASGSSDPARAAKVATSTIPIVFAMGGDPVATGLVSSLARPNANITGVTTLANDLQAKRLELLRDLLPKLAVVAYLQNPDNLSSAREADDVQAAARAIGCKIVLFTARAAADLDAVFASIAQQRFDALIVQPEPVFYTQRDQVIEFAARRRLPAIYANSEFPARGGLMSFSADIKDAYRQAGLYVGRILKGQTPAELPVLQPVKFELVINLAAAKALGIEFPPSLQLRADEVIE